MLAFTIIRKEDRAAASGTESVTARHFAVSHVRDALSRQALGAEARCYRAFDRLTVAAGAHQLAFSEPFQRCFRDALAAIQQPSNNWDNGRIAGARALLDRIRP